MSHDGSSQVVPTPEYFQQKQQQYVRQVSRGRHPRSFPRVSELWYHALATGKRLDKIRAGHNVWHVLPEEQDSSHNEHEHRADQSLADSENQLDSLQDSTVQNSMSHTLKPIPTPAPVQLASTPVFQLGHISVNGMQIDIRGKIQLHYGMMAILMSEKNDIVCVSAPPENQIKIKPCASVLPSDRTLFKLLDLRDSTSPHAVRYGEPLWLQIVDPSGNPGSTYGWNQASALCTKLFDLHEMDTKHLNPSWEKDSKRSALLSGVTNGKNSVAKDEYKLMSKSATSTASAEIATSPEGAVGGKAPTRVTGWKKIKQDVKLVIKDGLDDQSGQMAQGGSGAAKKGKGSAIDQISKTKERKGAGVERGDIRTQTNGFGGARGDPEPEAIICGGSQAVLIGALALQASRRMGDVDEAKNNTTAGKQISREAWIMGQVSLHAAERGSRQNPAGQLGEVALANTALFFAQDLYCLASSQGSTFVAWPHTSKHIAPPQDLLTPENSPEKPAHNEADDATVGSHVSAAIHGATVSKGTRKDGNAAAANIVKETFLVTRKLLAKKPPNDYIVDKRCVFRLCTVDNVSDTSQLSVQEISAAKLLSKAKEGLRLSELGRKGGKHYPAEPGDLVPISSGERFSRSLRQNVSSKLLVSEASILQPRRDKEKVITSHFMSYCADWDKGDHGDDVSVASMSIGKESILKRYYHPLDGGPSHDSISLGSLSQDERLDAGTSSNAQLFTSGGGSAGLSLGGSSVADRGRFLLPDGHEESYLQSQRQLLDESLKSSVVRPYHYNEYPHYYKKVSSLGEGPSGFVSKQFELRDPMLSKGEEVVSLRQNLVNIGDKVLHAMHLEAKLEEMQKEGTAGGDSASPQSSAVNRRKERERVLPAPRPDILAKIYKQDALIGRNIDHSDRLQAIENVKQNMSKFKTMLSKI